MNLRSELPAGAEIARGPDEPWALLWSKKQGVLHKEPLIQAMATGIAMLKGEREANDYILLYVGPASAVHDMGHELQPAVDARGSECPRH